MHVVVSGVIFSVSVSVDKQAGVVFTRLQVQQFGAVVFYRSPQHDFLRSVEKFHDCRVAHCRNVEHDVAVFLHFAHVEVNLQRLRLESVDVGHRKRVDRERVGSSRFPVHLQHKVAPAQCGVAQGDAFYLRRVECRVVLQFALQMECLAAVALYRRAGLQQQRRVYLLGAVCQRVQLHKPYLLQGVGFLVFLLFLGFLTLECEFQRVGAPRQIAGGVGAQICGCHHQRVGRHKMWRTYPVGQRVVGLRAFESVPLVGHVVASHYAQRRQRVACGGEGQRYACRVDAQVVGKILRLAVFVEH